MQIWALAAIFSSALLHATWNALLKGLRDQAAATVYIVAIAGGVSALLAFLLNQTAVPAAGWPYVLAAGLIEAVYFFTLAQAFSHLPLGTAYGVSRGAGLLAVWPLSMLIFAEPLDLHAAIGAVLLTAGLFVLIERHNPLRGLVMAGLCAVAVALYPLAYKQALISGVAPCALFALSLAIALPAQVIMLDKGRVDRLVNAARAAPFRLGIGGVLCACSFLLFLIALRVTGPGRITALRNTSVIFAALLSRLAGDPLSRRTVLSSSAIAAGAVLLSW